MKPWLFKRWFKLFPLLKYYYGQLRRFPCSTVAHLGPVSTIFVCLSFIAIHQQLNLCILSWQSLRSTPRLCTNTSKLVIKINSGVFVDLADLLAVLKCVRNSGSRLTWKTNSLVATAKKRAVEISCILVWIQAFTICQWIFWSTYHSCWWDTT